MIYLGLRVVGVQGLNCRLDLWLADVAVVVEHLTLEIRHVNVVEVDDPDGTDSGQRQVDRNWRAESACAYDQDLRVDQLALSRAADLRHDDVAAVPPHLVRSQGANLGSWLSLCSSE